MTFLQLKRETKQLQSFGFVGKNWIFLGATRNVGFRWEKLGILYVGDLMEC